MASKRDWTPNPPGHPESLVPYQFEPGNRVPETHGVYSSRRELPAEAEALVEDLMALGHVVPADRLAAEEVARLVHLIGRVDAVLAERSLTNPGRGRARTLLAERRLLSARLEGWLVHFGLTPKSRAEWVRTLAGPSLGERIREAVENGS